jgi:hypothetical protein
MPILLASLIAVLIVTGVVIHELMIRQINETKLVPHVSHWNRMRGTLEIYDLHRKLFPQSRLRTAFVRIMWVLLIPFALLVIGIAISYTKPE